MDNSNEIFISYRWGDRESDENFEAFVKEIEKSTGLKAFWDTRELRGGNFIDALQEGVRTAAIFMPVVTDNYIKFGTEGGRDEDKDFCLLEYATAVVAGKKIVPFFCGIDGNIKTVSDDAAKAAAERVLNLSYTADDAAILQQFLCSQNGVTIGKVSAEQISTNSGKLCSVVFDTFCSKESDITYYKKHLEDLAARLDPIRIFGDFDDSGLTLGNSYVPLSFLRCLTEKERKEKEDRKESTAPTDAGENTFLANLENERLAVIVGDVGQGKSSFVRHLTIQLAQQAQQNGLSRDLFFPLYLECKSIDRDSMSSCNTFWNELAEKSRLPRPALDAVVRFGKPLFIFDAMDEVSPGQMDALIDAIHKHIYHENKNSYILFTSRPGQKLVAGNGDMTLDNDRAIVRKYSVKEFNIEQRDGYIGNLAAAKKTASDEKESFIHAIEEKESAIADYRSITRNPFMIFAIFSTYAKGQELPDNRFDAIRRIIDDIIRRDMQKTGHNMFDPKNIKEILGAVSCTFNRQRDEGKTPYMKSDAPLHYAKEIYGLDDSDKDDRRLIGEYREFFSCNDLIDENGFRHEFLAATYAAYYLLFLMKKKVKKDYSPLDVKELTSLKKDTDYWKSVTEALLCLLDRESEDSKTYIEPLLEEMQREDQPEYDTLCNAVSQFTKHQSRAARILLQGMLDRGCEGILSGKQTASSFICEKGGNPYEELFYYPAIYPYLQQYLPGLNPGARQGEELYLCSELIKEVCALFSENEREKLKAVYNKRAGSEYEEINTKLVDAAYRNGEAVHGFVRIKDGVEKIDKRLFRFCYGLTSIFIPDSVTRIGEEAFDFCKSLTSIFIPDSVTRIGEGAFDFCKSLMSITIPDSVTEIGGGAFEGCTSLESITIPDSVTEIDDLSFRCCKSLTSMAIPDSVRRIGDGAFSYCKSLTSITIPDSVTMIGDSAFVDCTSLTNITIPDSVTEIDEQVFWGCTSLTSITIPDSVKKIGAAAFADCTSLTNITIPGSVTEIGRAAFAGCTSLTSLTIPDSVTKIVGSLYFLDLKSVTIFCKKGSYAEKYLSWWLKGIIPIVAE